MLANSFLNNQHLMEKGKDALDLGLMDFKDILNYPIKPNRASS